MELKSGKTRVVLVMNKNVIKFPNIMSLKGFVAGIYANFYEPLVYLKIRKDKRLGRVVFFIPGICVVMKKYDTDSIDRNIEIPLLAKHFEGCRCRLDLSPTNIGYDSNRNLVLIDYSPRIHMGNLGIFYLVKFLFNYNSTY